MPHTESLRLNTPGYKDVCQIHPTGLGEFVNGKFHTLMQVFSCLRTTTDNMLYGSPSPTDASETTYVSLCACLSHLDPRGPQAFHNAGLLRLVSHGHRACKKSHWIMQVCIARIHSTHSKNNSSATLLPGVSRLHIPQN